MRKVYQAEAYRPAQMGSFGNASYMLIKQHNFPHTYNEETEKLATADSDRCQQWDFLHAGECFKKHTGTGPLGLEAWVRQAWPKDVMAFLVDILKVEEHYPGTKWTGWRVMGTVNRSNGYPVWSLQLFAKKRGSKTKVYKSQNAPNVKGSSVLTNKGQEIFLDPYGRDVFES